MRLKVKKSILSGLSIALFAASVSAFAGLTTEAYVIKGKRYQPLKTVVPGYEEEGVASWYDIPTNFGIQTASGEHFNDQAMTAASPILPMNTKVRVTNLKNNKSVIVRINDRGPYKYHRIIDLSRAAAVKLGYEDQGIAKVKVTVVS